MSKIKFFLKYIYYYVYKTKIVSLFYKIKKIREKEKYLQIIKYKNIYKNKRCFIIATGPSLTLEDVNKLKNEITISMNSIIKIFLKTNWRPTYYMIQDKEIYEVLKNEIKEFELNNIFYADILLKFCKGSAIPYRLDLQKHLLGVNETKFSEDIEKKIYDGYTVTYSAIQLACYMGFTEIVLLGCDTNYNKKNTHFQNYTTLSKGTENFYNYAVKSYEMAKKYCDSKGVTIYNATKGGMLEVFPRVDLDEFINEKNRR